MDSARSHIFVAPASATKDDRVMTDAQKPRFVRCPEMLDPMFVEAERIMDAHFSAMTRKPERGELDIGGVRYLLMQSESFSIELHEELRKAFGDAGASQIRYRIGRALGLRDARVLHNKLGITEPLRKLAVGPVHFAYVGWAFVSLNDDPAPPSSSEDSFMTYTHPHSFEADAYVERGIKADRPVCAMNAGYSSGWNEASFDAERAAQEITCRACGHDQCCFVLGHPKKLDGLVREYKKKLGVR